MKKKINNLNNFFVQKMLEIRADPDELKKLNSIHLLSENTIAEAYRFLGNSRFVNQQDEIDFFKQVNSQFLSPPIEQGLRYSILNNKPISTNEALIHYFEEALKTLQSFFVLNNFHYQYYKNGFKELDSIYFLRNSGPLTIPILEIPAQMKEFCPPMSYLFAKFSAYENVQRFILDEISALRIVATMKLQQAAMENEPEIKWTGDTINVTELAYGLWLTGQLNHGNASLNQIVRWLEKNLSVSIGIAQRKFSEISQRKRISITKYTDQMREAILKKIDADYQ